MPVGDIYAVRMICQWEDQLGLNVRHFRVNSVVAPEPPITSVAIDLFGLFGPLYQPLMIDSAQFRGVGLRKIRPLPVGLEIFSVGAALPGTRTGDALPQQVSGVITLRTALAGRRNRGRAYIPFPAEVSSNVSGYPMAAYVTDLQLLGNALASPRTIVVGIGSMTLQPVIFHRATGLTDDVVTSVARSRWGTQRRRGAFGATNVPPI